MDIPWIDPSVHLVVADGEAYDMEPFIDKHPGGALLIIMAKGKDISTSIHTYHKRSDKVKAVLKKFHVGPADPMTLDPKYVAPEYRAPNHFEIPALPLPLHDFTLKDSFQKALIKAIDADPELKKRLRYLDNTFLRVMAGVFATYLLVVLGFLTHTLNPWLCVPVFATLRLCLLAPGHYAAHEKQPNWRTAFLNIGYFGSSLKGPMIHSIRHHSYPGLSEDPKRDILTNVFKMPRVWRFPLQTAHLFLLFIGGLLIDAIKISFQLMSHPAYKQMIVPVVSYWAIKSMVIAEMVIAYNVGLFWPWTAQFLLTVWWNHALLMFSHDYLPMEDPKEQASVMAKAPNADWGLFQIESANEMAFTGIIWIDCILSTGQSCHAVHHLLPFQRTGWSNIACMPLVKKMAEERGMVWKSKTMFFTRLIPTYIKGIATLPMMGGGVSPKDFMEENFSWLTVQVGAKYLYDSIILG